MPEHPALPSSRAVAVLRALIQSGVRAFSGVPCSFLGGLFTLIEEQAGRGELLYAPAVREDSALAVTVGFHLAGQRSCVLMQNSGLGNAINVLTSLNAIYRIPTLLIVSWRGAHPDAVEHDVMGARLEHILDALEIPHHLLDFDEPERAVRACLDVVERRSLPAAVLVDRIL